MRWNEVGAGRQAARLAQLLRTISPTYSAMSMVCGAVVGAMPAAGVAGLG